MTKAKQSEKELSKIELNPLVRARDRNRCCFCKRDIYGVSEELIPLGELGLKSIHHIIPLRYNGKNVPNNCLTICNNCHKLLEVLISRVEKEAKQEGIKIGEQRATERDVKTIKDWTYRLLCNKEMMKQIKQLISKITNAKK